MTRPKLLVALGIAVALYAMLGFLIAPRVIRSSVLDALSETVTTRPVLGEVRVNPFALSVTLRNFRMPDERGGTAIGFERLYLRFNLFSPFFGAWTLDELRIEKPTVNAAILPDRTLNLLNLLRVKPAVAPPGGKPPKPPALLVRHLTITDGTVSYQDDSRQPPFQKALIPVRIELRDFTTRQDRKNAYSLDARTDRGETLAWNGRFTLQPFRSEGRLQIGALQCLTVEDFLGGVAPYQFTRGAIDFGAEYDVDAATTPARFALSRMNVAIHDLGMTDRATGEEAVAAGLIEAKDGAVRSDSMAADLGTVRVDSLRVRVWMDSSGTTNLQRWSQARSEARADTASPWATRLALATIERAEVEFQDRRLSPPALLEFHQLKAELKSYDSAPGTKVPLSAACSTGTGGRAVVSGALVPSTGAIDLALDVAGFDLRQLQPFVSAFAKLGLSRGTLDAKGRLLWNSFGASGPMLRFTGDLVSSQFRSVDPKVRQDFLRWRRLEIKALEYDQAPGRVAVREVVATNPYIRFIVAPDLTTSIQAIAVPPDSVPPAFRPKPGAQDTIPMNIHLVRVVDGSMDYADLSLTPNFATGIHGMNGTISELSSAEAAHAVMDIAGKVDEQAPVTFSGTINPLNGRGVTDLTARFENIELTTFTPYSGKFMGYEISRGKLDLDLHYFIQDRKLRAENRILIRQLTLGRKVDSPDATSLPVKFAIALLKNKNGDIDLNLPVHGDLDDPKFSVVPIVMKVLVNVIVKAVTSPFKLFGAIFGGDDEEVAPAIHFPYGSAALDTTEVKKLDAIHQGLADRPGLRLEIEQCGQRERDSLAMLDVRYRRALAEAGRSSRPIDTPPPAMIAAAALRPTAGLTPSEYARALSSAYVAEFGKLPPIEKLEGKRAKDPTTDQALIAAEDRRLARMEGRVRAGILVAPDDVGGLAVERARSIQRYLLRDSTILADRLFIVAPKGTYPADSTGVLSGLSLTD
ncbi:MAG TPA: DUF748 domain-containing protein [Candidatus Eisenbacteria bacterium]|nr:DUF748 domain-containing protein [Candidatus Eisenbacteria bacterium]